jgi:transcriptional regulator with XRE-family HTH domain
MKEKLADRIRKARLMRNLSQQNMADELEITVAAYSNIERGVTELTVTRLFQIATIFEINPIELLDFKNNVKSNLNEPREKYIPESRNQEKIQIENILKLINDQQIAIKNLSEEVAKLKK